MTPHKKIILLKFPWAKQFSLMSEGFSETDGELFFIPDGFLRFATLLHHLLIIEMLLITCYNIGTCTYFNGSYLCFYVGTFRPKCLPWNSRWVSHWGVNILNVMVNPVKGVIRPKFIPDKCFSRLHHEGCSTPMRHLKIILSGIIFCRITPFTGFTSLRVLTPQCDIQREFQSMHFGRKVHSGHPKNTPGNTFHDDFHDIHIDSR